MYTISRSNTFRRPVVRTVSSISPCEKCTSPAHKSVVPLHGSRLFQRVAGLKKILWTLYMLLMIMGSVFMTYTMFREYIEYQTTTHLTVIQNDSLLLPSIHICPKNADQFNYDVIFNDIDAHLGVTNFSVRRDVLLFFVAGSGFQNTDIDLWSKERVENARRLFETWKGQRTTAQLFNFVFNKNGLTCKDVFTSCLNAERPIDCCKLFKPHYVMLRGKCMRLDNFYQNGVHETDRLTLNFGQPESLLIDGKKQKQFVVYFGDKYPEIAFFPRVYITKNDYGKLKLKPRKIFMEKDKDICSSKTDEKGRATCFVNRWALENIIEPFNCTLPYMTNIKAARGYPDCDPGIIVDHYAATMAATVSKYKYEIYTEARLTSLSAFVSQVGGQIVLYLGSSVITVVYLACFIFHILWKMIKQQCLKA